MFPTQAPTGDGLSSSLPTPAPSALVVPTNSPQCEADLEECHQLVNEVTAPLSNFVLSQPEESFNSESWQFTEVLTKVTEHIPEGFELTLADFDGFAQYALSEVETGRLYATCIFHDDVVSTECPEQAQCGANDSNGWPNAVARKLKEALRRNNFRHEFCASVRETCEFWPGWWKQTLVEKLDFSTIQIDDAVAERMSHNICVSPSNELLYVTKDEIKRTCVGFGEQSETCENNRDYMCSGFSLGRHTYGWPGQISQAIGVALNAGENGETDYFHPQCAGLQNRLVTNMD